MNKRKQQSALLSGIFMMFTLMWLIAGVYHVAFIFALAAAIALYDFWKGGILP